MHRFKSYMVDNEKSARTQRIVQEFVYCLFRGEKTMPILYYFPLSPPCRAILLLGRLLNIDFDLRFLDITQGDQLKPDFIKVKENYSEIVEENTFLPISK